jgi:hypothetical protein
MSYRLDVVAATVAEAVRFAGGWLFDRVMAGWDVKVIVANLGDDRPLQILGAEMLDLEYVLASASQYQVPQTLAVATDLFESDARVREGVLTALEHGLTEVTLWGETWPDDLDNVDSVQHRLSAAARAFKARALAAAAAPAAFAGEAESFISMVMATPPVAKDLVPAS